jgi:L-amino acid N-acyltransferase YncA
MNETLLIRKAGAQDKEVIWSILEPVIKAGETYTLPQDMSRDKALAYWFEASHEVWVAEIEEVIVGTYFICPNQRGGGSHVANCGYMTASSAQGKGIARAMCQHSLEYAIKCGFKAMQFNFVVSSNHRAVKLWESFKFDIVGRLPLAFLHPTLGYVDAFVMFRFF